MADIVVTFDLFSALIDSRTGAAKAFARIADGRGWPWSGAELYDRWDGHNKRLQRSAEPPTTFHDLSLRALELAYAELEVPPEYAASDLAIIEESVAEWPLWPDVAVGVPLVGELAAVGILSNVDDALLRTTQAARLVEPDLLLSSQRLGAYKPSPEIYLRAADAVRPRRLVHVPASARDTRGALEAGVDVVRLARPGHVVDPDGPQPPHQVDSVVDVAQRLREW